MNQLKILIFGVAAVQGDAIIKLKEMGHEVHAIARDRDGPGADLADFFSPIDFSDIPDVVNYIKQHEIDFIYSVGSDAAMPLVNKISEMLNLPSFNSYRVASICNDKPTLRQILGDRFQGNVKHLVLTSSDHLEGISFPVIIKPADSQGQRGIFLVEDGSDLISKFNSVQNYSNSKRVIVEKYIGGDEVSVNGYVVDGKLVFCLVTNRVTWSRYLGRIHKHVIPYQAEPEVIESVKQMMQSASDTIGVKNGPIYAQIKIENKQPYIIEFTPRLDGCHMWKLIRYATGFDLLKLTLEHLLENNLSELEKYQEDNVTPYVLEFMCQQPVTLADYTAFEKEIKGSHEHYFYYQPNDIVRPVNGVWDKIGYFIYPTDPDGTRIYYKSTT